MDSSPLERIAFVGNYVPRRCGIATFTHDLRGAVASHVAGAECLVVAMNDGNSAYDYPPEVRIECADDEPDALRRAADFLNLSNVDVVSLQHEFGIFGGDAGSNVLALLHDLRIPVHTTLHTVLARPSDTQRRVLDEVIRLSSRVAVMTDRGRALLEAVHGVPSHRIDVVPHGIPDAPPAPPGAGRDRLGLAGRRVILTFGLLSPNKGIEHAIAAMPAVVARHPDVRYVVVGATHPHLLRGGNDSYRESLTRLAHELGVDSHVTFHDRYVDTPELLAFLDAADIYVTPYLNEDQIVSGTLAYAFGRGKAVVSTPYWHARELLGDGDGVLVPFRDSEAIASAIDELLSDDVRREAMRRRAHARGRGMVWSRVAARYADAFRRTRSAGVMKRRTGAGSPAAAPPRRLLPPLVLDHLLRLTDSTGVMQHASYDIPRFSEGHCTDDNARALALTVELEAIGADSTAVRTVSVASAAFLEHAFEPSSGRFRNFLSFDRRWLDEAGSDDCLGRAILALGACIGRSRKRSLVQWAMRLVAPAVGAAVACTSPRAWALSILGISDALRRFDGDRPARWALRTLTDRLVSLRHDTATADWPWFETVVAYENPRLCEAVIRGGTVVDDDEAVAAGLESLAWLHAIQTSPNGRFAPVGCRGFFPKGHGCAAFDQQPIEAQAMVAACLEAHRVTGHDAWLDRAWTAFEWFRGHNVLGLALCDSSTGGCRDGLLVDRTNENQGAESTLAFLAALTAMRSVDRSGVGPGRPVAARGTGARSPR